MQKSDRKLSIYTPCRKCTITRIVMFMAVGMILMAMMFLQPPQAVLLAAQLPSALTIGLGIVGLGSVEFLRRWIAHRR